MAAAIIVCNPTLERLFHKCLSLNEISHLNDNVEIIITVVLDHLSKVNGKKVERKGRLPKPAFLFVLYQTRERKKTCIRSTKMR
jgi:hypothetical protein